MLRFAKLRVVVNGSHIYSLAKNQPAIIDMPTNPARVVITDGFHITSPFELGPANLPHRVYRIVCVIDDEQLVVGSVIMGLLYAMGTTSGMLLLQVLSMLPVFYFLFLYYVKRREFIQLQAL